MADIGNCNETPVAEPQLQQTQMGFLHPPGFEVAAFLIVAIDKNGQPYTNAPPHTAVALRLATLAMDFASQKAIVHMQKSDTEQSRIVAAPAGAVPPPRKLTTFRPPLAIVLPANSVAVFVPNVSESRRFSTTLVVPIPTPVTLSTLYVLLIDSILPGIVVPGTGSRTLREHSGIVSPNFVDAAITFPAAFRLIFPVEFKFTSPVPSIDNEPFIPTFPSTCRSY